MELSKYSKKQKNEIIKSTFKQISKLEAINDFIKLRNMPNPCSGYGSYGTKLINKFTLLERLSTKGRSGYSYFDLYHNGEYLKTKNYVDKLFKYYKNRRPANINYNKFLYDIFGLYFGRPHIFKPTIAMYIYCMYKPTSILDMTMGWGGRLVGACALDIKKYTGIDLNKNLEIPYKNMIEILDPLCDTEIELYFGDALDFNYESYYYDLVLTSPPYYNIEIYGNQIKKTKDEWNNNFYIPLITKSYNGLSIGGHYCLNIPIYLYKDIAVPLLGEAQQSIPLILVSRHNQKTTYKEYIYVWKK
jgi:hypothetical protein